MKLNVLPIGLALIGLLLSSSTQAQITIEQSDYVMVSTPDYRMTYIHSDNYLNYKTPAGGENKVWSYAAITGSYLADYNYYKTSDAFFSGSHHYEAARLEIASFGVPTDFHHRFDANGYTAFAKEQHDSTISLQDVTGNPDDHVHFVADKQLYKGERSQIVFPLNYGKQWTDDLERSTPFELTITAYGLNKAPGYHNRIENYESEVIGHGKLYMSFRTYDADTMEVLLVKTSYTAIDSFFLGGSPAPDQLLNALGLVQGLKTERTEYAFFRKGYGDLLLEMRSEFATPGSSMTNMFLNVDGIVGGHLSAETSAIDYSSAKVYPNPLVEQGTVHLELPTNSPQATQFRLMDIQGKTIEGDLVNRNAGSRVTLDIPIQAQNGVYIIQAIDSGGVVLFERKMVINR